MYCVMKFDKTTVKIIKTALDRFYPREHPDIKLDDRELCYLVQLRQEFAALENQIKRDEIEIVARAYPVEKAHLSDLPSDGEYRTW